MSIAWLEGLADATASVLKLFAGRWSDRTGRRRPFMFAGYGLSSAIRPLVAFATAPWHVVVVRVIDRIGKGLRSSPRDALLGDSTTPDRQGLAFGFHRGMDHAGAVIGPLVAVAVLTWWTDDLRTLFLLAAIPGVLAVLTIGLAVAERRATPTDSRKLEPLPAASRSALLRVLVPLGVFTLGNASDLFLLLYAGGHDVPLEGLPLLWVALHIVRSIGAPLGGALGDRIGHRTVILLGFVVYAVVYLAFAVTTTPLAITALFVAYGLHSGLTEGPMKALVSSSVPATQRATAFGWYHLVVGLLSLPASLLFAAIWEGATPSAAFITGASLAAGAAMLLAVTGKNAVRE
jgi:MFS family permease